MKTNNYIRSLFITLIATFSVSLFVLAEDAKSGGLTGGYVVDDAVTVPANAYVSFSTVSGGKRYYLGVDTTAAESGTYRVAVYNKPCYATIWQVGPFWSYTGEKLDDKNYQRTVKSVYIDEKCPAGADKFLSVGTDRGTWSDLELTANEAEATLWFTQKDNTASGKYIQGFLYYSYEQASTTIYRYLTYDGLYGFDRLYSSRPAVSQRVSIWGRTTGDQMACYFMPSDIEFEYNADPAGEPKVFTYRMRLELDGDRFRSQFDGTEFYAKEPTVIDDQQVLRDTYGVTFDMGWSSTHDTPAKRDTSIAHWPARDSAMIAILTATPATIDVANNRWQDDMKTIGKSPKNIAGVTKDHVDYIHIHMHYGGNTYDDSTRVIRRLYQDRPFTVLNTQSTPQDHAFPYSTDPQSTSFTIAANYADGNEVVGLEGTVISRSTGEASPITIATRPCYRDTVWAYDGEGNPILDDEDKPTWVRINLLDTLLVSAYLADGVTPATGATANKWIQSLSLTARNQISVTAKAYYVTTEYRRAVLKYSYTYRHSSAKGDTVRAEGVIWLSQAPATPSELGALPFYHQNGASGAAPGRFGRQQAPELVYTTYIIPNTPLSLPIHHDLWGYNRWYNYQDGATRDRDISQNWTLTTTPKNYSGGEFVALNATDDPTSKGRFDMRFTVNNATNAPAIQHKAVDVVTTKSDTLACDISIYRDTTSTGSIATSLTSFTEPTLGYRQLFAVRPATEMAERMENCRRRDGTRDTLQKMTFIAPYGRRYHITPESPYKTTDGQIEEGHLQYVYYYNPNEDDNDDENMGKEDGLDKTNGRSYHRIGLPARTTGGDPNYYARLMTAQEILDMQVGDHKTVFMINPRRNGGYILGANDRGGKEYYEDILSGRTDTADLRKHIEDDILNNDKFKFDYYLVTLTKTQKTEDVNKITLRSQYFKNDLCAHASIMGLGEGVDWYNNTWIGSSEIEFDIAAHTCTSDDRITYIDPALLELYNYVSRLGNTYYGWLSACAMRRERYVDHYEGWPVPIIPVYAYRYVYDGAALRLYYKDYEEMGGENTVNQGWCFYEIIPPTDLVEHAEHPKWYRKKQGANPWVPEDDDTWTSVDILPDGTMTATYSTDTDPYVDYKLESEHFNLVKARVYLRDPAKEGPSTSAIITEDSIDNHYSVMTSLGLEQIPVPGTTDIVTPPYHLQFNHTQFAFHYPVGSGEHEIPASKRVSGEDRMPAKGEYITTNKFEKAGHTPFEACAGAEHGYMFCYNRASKPLVFLDFTIDQPACTDQEMTIVANFANPSSNAPHVTAKMYGKLTPESDWTLIYTYLTGEMEQSDRWYQVVLPLAKDTINKYKAFRCVGTVSGTDDNSDAFLLFDRMRLLSKDRPLTSYQKRTTCQTNDSIFIISRIDYKSNDIEPGSIICYQYQRWDNTANGGAGGYVPMQASRKTGETTYERLPANETQVYPGYYKVGMTAEESVTDYRFKSSVLNADYGTIVVPGHNYNPANSGSSEGQDTLRKAAIDEIAALYGDDRSSYYNETGRRMPYSEITTAESFNDDFGDYDNPKCKFYVNEGTAESPHWVMYLINRVKVGDSDNGTFRIAMNYVSNVKVRPNFSESACSTERIIEVKHAVDALVDEKVLGTTWHNYTRTELKDNPGYDAEYLPANTAHTIDLRFTPPAGYKEGTANRADCRFDLVRAFEFMRDYVNKTPEQQAAADAQWEVIYRCTVGEFQDAMNIFRSEDNDNPNCDVYQWNDVTPESFIWGGISPTKADSAYKLLDRLVRERLLEVGLSTRELYISNNQDLYFYLRPIAASGTYIVSAHDGTDSVATASVCNDPIWLEMHSKQSTDSLRFGYDKKFGDAYAIPVIRASATVANSALPVRVAAISHDDLAHSGIVIGFDSTHVVETNDPAWIPGTSTFRYTQDRIVQERLYSGYYKEGDTILFRPVNAAHISALIADTCECLNYDPKGTDYDPAHPRNYGVSGTNVFVRPAAEQINGCNQWHMLPSTSDPDPRKHMPGYHVENNFELHAGYWYKFKTAFFHTGTLIPYNTGDNPAGANSAYFILAIAPETAVWTPSNDDRTNYWNDDNNWTAIVNGEPFHEAIARVPLEGTNVIVGRPAIENHLPVVNNDSLGDVTKGDIDWGFKTATCQDILFRPLGQIYGQEYLDYRRAFTDVRFQEGTWRTFTPALKNIYSGDMYVPEDSAADMRSYFAPLTFNSGSSFGPDHNRVWPYLFFQSFYNQTVREAFNNTDVEGNLLTYREKSSAQWVQTNVLDKAFTPGAANAIIAWGPEGNTKDIIVRLPKQESTYTYLSMEGDVVSDPIPMGSRPAFDEIRQNLAFDKDALNGNTYVDYTLTNQTPAKLFFFGNATMELIDVYQLCLDNADKLENEGGTSFVVYELTGESAYAVYVLNPNTVDRHNLFLAPMRAIGINAKSASTSLTIRLNTSALIPMPGSMRPVQDIESAPKRRSLAYEEPYSATLYISATGTADGEKYKAYITLGESNNASDAFVGGEDAECLLSHNTGDFTFHTPLTMYTVCDNRTLMYDSRELVGRVPLGFSMLSDYNFDDRIILSFATEGHWDRPLYLHDALSGDSIMIMNGMRISVLAPQNDELRYYINGGGIRSTEQTTGGEEIPTGIEEINVPINDQMVHDQMVNVYDVLGRKVAVLGENDLLIQLKLPTGVYVIQRGDKTERVVIR